MNAELTAAIATAIRSIKVMAAVKDRVGPFGLQRSFVSDDAVDTICKQIISLVGYRYGHPAAADQAEADRVAATLSAMNGANISKVRGIAGNLSAFAAAIDSDWAVVRDELEADAIPGDVDAATAAQAILWTILDTGSVYGAVSIEGQVQ